MNYPPFRRGGGQAPRRHAADALRLCQSRPYQRRTRRGSSRKALFARGRRAARRQPSARAKAGRNRQSALDWGLPVLESRLTLIEGGRLYYRGEDAVTLSASAAASRASRPCSGALPAAEAFGPECAVLPEIFATRARRQARDDLLARLCARHARRRDRGMARRRALAAGCGALVRLLLACTLGARADAAPIHRQCADAWRLDERGAEARSRGADPLRRSRTQRFELHRALHRLDRRKSLRRA